MLYGDPTEELYQALAGGSTAVSPSQMQPGATISRFVNGGASRSGVPAIHVADRVARKWVSGPGIVPVDSEERGADESARSSKPALSSSKTPASDAGECQAHARLEAPRQISMAGCRARRSRRCWQTTGSAGSCRATVETPA